MIVFLNDNYQILSVLLIGMLLGGLPMVTALAQELKTDSAVRASASNRVVISKRDMRMYVLHPQGDTVQLFV